MKKFLSILLVIVAFITCFDTVSFAQDVEITPPNDVFTYTFDEGTEGWYSFQSSNSILHEIRSEEDFDYCISGYNEKKSWVSPAVNIYSIIKENGPGTYTINAELMFAFGGIATEARMVLRSYQKKTFLHNQASDGSYYNGIGICTQLNGYTWTNMSGSFKIQAEDLISDSGELILCFDSLLEANESFKFSVDNVTITKLNETNISNGDFSYGTLGWRNWASYGNFYTITDTLLGISYANYLKASTYGSIATNVDQILSNYGGTEYVLKFQIRLIDESYDNLERLAIYLSKGSSDYHFCVKNLYKDDITKNQWCWVTAVIDTTQYISNRDDCLFNLLSPQTSEVFFRIQYDGEASESGTYYLIKNASFTLAPNIDYINFEEYDKLLPLGWCDDFTVAANGDFENPCTPSEIRYVSSNPDVLRVNEQGDKITAVGVGKANLFVFSTIYESKFDVCPITVGNTITDSDGNQVIIYSEGEEYEDEYAGEEISGLHVYVNDIELETVRRNEDGEILACMGELTAYLATENFLNPACTEWYVMTSHADLEVFCEKTYYTADLELCETGDIRDSISLSQFISDMGYTPKYNSIKYKNGAEVIFIYGNNPHSRTPLNLFSWSEILSLGLGFIPVIGDSKDLVEGVFGYDAITGEPLNAFDRIICIGCTIVPVVSGATLRVGKKGLTTLDNVLDYADTLSDAHRLEIYSDIWTSLRPTTRGLAIEDLFSRQVYKKIDGWVHVGEMNNGFFPVIDFVRKSNTTKYSDVISLKSLDPNLYKLANGEYNTNKLKTVISNYAKKLSDAKISIDDIPIDYAHRTLEIAVPKGCANVIEDIISSLRRDSNIAYIITEV